MCLEDIGMPGSDEPEKTLHEVMQELGIYPIEAFEFVQKGLSYTVNKTHGPADQSQGSRHVSGQQLCLGLRDYALMQWGMLAGTVLHRWNINSTYDFGRIVFALIDAGFMQKTERDTIEDFRAVYDFRQSFDAEYKIEAK
ncbi:MAG TPA: Minf_1886 family protein [Tepidisphaeraceae bacterium]|nr:Minf_1886 family protein [Tepidisphaeraceae bacterium]